MGSSSRTGRSSEGADSFHKAATTSLDGSQRSSLHLSIRTTTIAARIVGREQFVKIPRVSASFPQPALIEINKSCRFPSNSENQLKFTWVPKYGFRSHFMQPS